MAAIPEVRGRFPAPTFDGAGSDGIVSDNPLCFSSAVHHFPNKCPKQFGLAKACRTTQQPLILMKRQRAGQHRDWRSWKKFDTYTAKWKERHQHLIGDPTMPPMNHLNELDDEELDHNIHSDGSPFSPPVDDHSLARNDGHSPPLTCSQTDPIMTSLLSTGGPIFTPVATVERGPPVLADTQDEFFPPMPDGVEEEVANEKPDGAGDEIGGNVVHNEARNEAAKRKRKSYSFRSRLKAPRALNSATAIKHIHLMRVFFFLTMYFPF